MGAFVFRLFGQVNRVNCISRCKFECRQFRSAYGCGRPSRSCRCREQRDDAGIRERSKRCEVQENVFVRPSQIWQDTSSTKKMHALMMMEQRIPKRRRCSLFQIGTQPFRNRHWFRQFTRLWKNEFIVFEQWSVRVDFICGFFRRSWPDGLQVHTRSNHFYK